MITLRRHEKRGGWIIPVAVTPRSGKNEILPFSSGDEAIRLKVTALPDKGQANSAVLALLSDGLGIPRLRIEIASGETSRHKQVLLSIDWDVELLRERLAAATRSSSDSFTS